MRDCSCDDRRVLGVSFAGRESNERRPRRCSRQRVLRSAVCQSRANSTSSRFSSSCMRSAAYNARCGWSSCATGAPNARDAIAGALHDVTVIPAHRIDHQLQRRIDNRARFSDRDPVQARSILDVGEQRRDRLALAFEIFRGRRLVIESANHPISSTAPALQALCRTLRKSVCRGLSAPHSDKDSRVPPQSPQNFLPAGFQFWQFEQRNRFLPGKTGLVISPAPWRD